MKERTPERPTTWRPKFGEKRQLRRGTIRIVAYINDTFWWSVPDSSFDNAPASMPKRETVSWKNLKRIGE